MYECLIIVSSERIYVGLFMFFDSRFGRCSVINVVAGYIGGYYVGAFDLCLFNKESFILDIYIAIYILYWY